MPEPLKPRAPRRRTVRPPVSGRFVTFEGGEGAGKSTQVRLLAERLRQAGLDVVTTREPGGSAGAEILRHVILSGAAKPLGPLAEATLFAAARADHLDATIRPALAAGRWVICDRFADSTRVYQGALGQVDAGLLRELEVVTVGETRPDLTLILDVPAEAGLSRAAARSGAAADRFESESLSFHQHLREAFIDLARAEPERCAVIDGLRDIEVVAADIWRVVGERLPLPAGRSRSRKTS
ncbi:dTMP kinase [Ancylobacter sp. Lp-2]|uniref:dTMP kinase n=1 Tax=Ancylobacter sp. Lp-2 TaxID=2881339 RepID=UPI001E60CA48|nr:dTMP kinase [Ancylobacter sp. Lp-2]MCB4768309.1 dTMP kinase [Ancylobacter sp. Lp-2]